jgi:hypothetical protein
MFGSMKEVCFRLLKQERMRGKNVENGQVPKLTGVRFIVRDELAVDFDSAIPAVITKNMRRIRNMTAQ